MYKVGAGTQPVSHSIPTYDYMNTGRPWTVICDNIDYIQISSVVGIVNIFVTQCSKSVGYNHQTLPQALTLLPDNFIKISRYAVINQNNVKKITRTETGYLFTFAKNKTLEIGYKNFCKRKAGFSKQLLSKLVPCKPY